MPASDNIRQRVAAKALITNAEGKLLILREASTYKEGTNHGRYHVPGGRITPGEPFFDGLRREVREETGLEIEIGHAVFVGEWFPVIFGQPHHIVAMFISCKAGSKAISLSDEHDDYRWVNPGEIDSYDIMGPEPEAVRAWQRLCSR